LGATIENAFNSTFNSGFVTTGTSTTVFSDSAATLNSSGAATGGAAQGTTITFANPIPNCVVGWYVTGTNVGAGAQVTSLTSGGTTVNVSVPNAGAVSGTITFNAWYTNSLVGKRVKILSSTASGNTSEQTISANTTTQITVSTALGGTPTASASTYSIVVPPIRSTGSMLQWVATTSDTTKRGKYMYSARGGGVAGIDRLDITTDRWNLMHYIPIIETLTTGSMYAYDGGDRIYFTKDVTNRVYYIDLLTYWVYGAGMFPYTIGTSTVLGNRMEIFATTDGLKYLWLNRQGFTECFRQLLFY